MTVRRKSDESQRPGPVVGVRCIRAGSSVAPRTVRRRAEKILHALGMAHSELSILLCDDDLIRDLNREHRDVDSATDVLSFSMQDENDPADPARMLGDVVISIETAVRQASRHGRSVGDEVTTLLVHGVLHRAGYDHRDDEEKGRMNVLARHLESIVSVPEKRFQTRKWKKSQIPT